MRSKPCTSASFDPKFYLSTRFYLTLKKLNIIDSTATHLKTSITEVYCDALRDFQTSNVSAISRVCSHWTQCRYFVRRVLLYVHLPRNLSAAQAASVKSDRILTPRLRVEYCTKGVCTGTSRYSTC